jgi:hypothetical protein
LTDLIAMARAMPSETKVSVLDRLTVIVLFLGNHDRRLLQILPTITFVI